MRRRSSLVKTGWRKHFEGWQLAVVLIVSALTPALLAVPHGTVSRELPLPAVDRAEQHRVTEQERELAWVPLPYPTRAIGEGIRRYGALRARGEQTAADWVLSDVQDAVQAIKRDGQLQSLLQLRATQAGLFVAAAQRWTGGSASESDTDLLELGGEFLANAKQAGWTGNAGVLATPDELRTWFVIRWNTLTQLAQEPQLMVSLNDWRAYYRFLLREDHEPPGVARMDLLSYRRQVLSALAQKDPDYPIDLALGLLSCQQADYGTCADLLRRHLRQTPDGPWSLRARNSLSAATAVIQPARR